MKLCIGILFLLCLSPLWAQLPHGWESFSPSPAAFDASLDSGQAQNGRRSGRIRSRTEVKTRQWVSLFQKIDAREYRGRRVLLKGYLKADQIQGWSGLFLRVDDAEEKALAFDNSSNRPLRGDSDWTLYSIELDVPHQAAELHFGLILSGPGSAWLDNLSLQAVGPTRPGQQVIQELRQRQLPREPVNLDFER